MRFLGSTVGCAGQRFRSDCLSDGDGLDLLRHVVILFSALKSKLHKVFSLIRKTVLPKTWIKNIFGLYRHDRILKAKNSCMRVVPEVGREATGAPSLDVQTLPCSHALVRLRRSSNKPHAGRRRAHQQLPWLLPCSVTNPL